MGRRLQWREPSQNRGARWSDRISRWSPDGNRIRFTSLAWDTYAQTMRLRPAIFSRMPSGVVTGRSWPSRIMTAVRAGCLTWSSLVARESIRHFDVQTRQTETIVSLKNYRITGNHLTSLGLLPDDSPLILKDAGSQELYALEWATE